MGINWGKLGNIALQRHAQEILQEQEKVILFDGNVEILLKNPALGKEQTANGGVKNGSF